MSLARPPAMRALALVMLLPTLASADEQGPAVAVGLEYSFGHGGHVEQMDLGTRLESGLFVRVGRWQATLGIPVNPKIQSSDVDRDTETLTGMGVGGRVAYRAPFFGGVLTVAGGLSRRYVWAAREVQRTCTQTRACIAGTYMEVPDYAGWSPQLRVGIGADKLLPTMVLAISADLIVEPTALQDVPPDGIRNVAVAGALTFTVGWGPKR